MYQHFPTVPLPNLNPPKFVPMAEGSENGPKQTSFTSDRELAHSSNNRQNSYKTAIMDPTNDLFAPVDDKNMHGAACDGTGRLLKPAPGYRRHLAMKKGSSAISRLLGHETLTHISKPRVEEERSTKTASVIVIGIFDGNDRVPKEHTVTIGRPSLLFWTIWLHILSLRGIYYFFSLEDVKGFRVYKVRSSTRFLHHQTYYGNSVEAQKNHMRICKERQKMTLPSTLFTAHMTLIHQRKRRSRHGGYMKTLIPVKMSQR